MSKKVFVILFVILFVAVALIIIAAITFKPFGKAVLSIAAGSAYRKVGEASLETNERMTRMIAVYKTENKPFLLVGPCLFRDSEEEYEDFFFVNKTQVIRTSTDKGGDMWCRVFNRLYVMDDLSNCECLRTPFWNELKCDKDSSVGYDGATDSFVYTFKFNDDSTQTKLTIPAKHFTPDMVDAPNRTLKK